MIVDDHEVKLNYVEKTWHHMYSILPRTCFYSDRFIWPFTKAYVKIIPDHYASDDPVDFTWVHPDEFIILKLKGKI